MTTRTWAVGLLLLAAGLLSADEAYPLKIERSAKKGDRFTVSGSATHAHFQRLTLGEQSQEDSKYLKMTFEGEFEVLEVDKRGRVTKAKCLVRRCTVANEEGGQEKEGVAKGTILTESMKKGDSPLVSDKGEVPVEVLELIGEFLPAESPEKKSSLEQAFGSLKPRKPGDTWPVNAEAVVAAIEEAMGTRVEPEDVEGTVTFERVTEVGGQKCAVLGVDLTMANVVPADVDQALVHAADVQMHAEIALPLDESKRHAGEKTEMTYEVKVSRKDKEGRTVHLEARVETAKDMVVHLTK